MSLDEKDPVDEIDVIPLCRTDGTLETVALFRLYQILPRTYKLYMLLYGRRIVMKKKLRTLVIALAGFALGCAVGLDNTVDAFKASSNFVIESAESVVDTAKSLVND